MATQGTVVRARKASALPWGLVGMLAIVAGVEIHLNRVKLTYLSDRLMEWSSFGSDVKSLGVDSRILCFGDSLVKVGILPRVIESRTGMPTYNFALGYGQAPSSYFMLRNALESGARPSAVVVDFKWMTLVYPPEVNERYYPEMTTPAERAELAWRSGDLRFSATLFLSSMLTSIQARDDLRTSIVARLVGTPQDRLTGYRAWRMTWDANRGTSLAPVNLSYHGEVDVNDRSLFPNKWSCRPINRTYVRRFLRLAQKHNISVFWLIPPVHPAAVAQLEKSGVDRDYCAFVSETQRSFPGVTVVDGRNAGYGPSLFVDPTHLNRHGAEVLSADLGDLIRRTLRAGSTGWTGSATWARLPPFRPRDTGVAIRDVCESREALRVDAETIRR